MALSLLVLLGSSSFTYRPVLYKGSVECFVKTVKQEGFFALYKGLFPTYCRMVCISLIQDNPVAHPSI